jgi:hypothetical protein
MKSRTQLALQYVTRPKNRATIPQDAEWLTPAQLAALLQTSERTLRNWRAAGKGPTFIKHGNTIRYRKASLNIDKSSDGVYSPYTDEGNLN